MRKQVKDDNKELNPYNLDRFSKVPTWLIVLLLKYWAAAAAVFFIAIGGVDIGFDFSQTATDDPYANMAISILLMFLIGFFLALFMNYIIRWIVRLMYNRRNNTYKYNMVNCKGFKSFLLCLPYCMLISVILFFVVSFLSSKGWVIDFFGSTGGSGIEPFTYGLCFIVVDGIFLLIKNLVINIYDRYKYYKQIKED